jgi:OOP family OmpA-OmpF porin
MQPSNKLSFARRMGVRGSLLVVAASMLNLGVSNVAIAGTAQSRTEYRQGDFYHSPSAVTGDLAQVIFFRTASQQSSSAHGAHVYLDGQLEGSLMPNDYTRFCVKKGTYSIEAYVGDEPLFAGKADPKTEIHLEGGRTYFIAVSDKGNGEPVPYRREEAERLLQGGREQIAIINRASAVVPCEAKTVTLMNFRLDASVLFQFAKSNTLAITSAGRTELNQIADKIRELPKDSVTRVLVQGHADPIGSDSYNKKLSTERAQTVSHALNQAGISRGLLEAQGYGETQPIVDCPSSGNRQQLIACNAPNRRVEIRVEGVKPDQDASN